MPQLQRYQMLRRQLKSLRFQERGGVVTTLSGAEKAKFDKLMKDEVMPAMAKMIDADALEAAQAYAKSN